VSRRLAFLGLPKLLLRGYRWRRRNTSIKILGDEQQASNRASNDRGVLYVILFFSKWRIATCWRHIFFFFTYQTNYQLAKTQDLASQLYQIVGDVVPENNTRPKRETSD
jgi:hypothetical protein